MPTYWTMHIIMYLTVSLTHTHLMKQVLCQQQINSKRTAKTPSESKCGFENRLWTFVPAHINNKKEKRKQLKNSQAGSARSAYLYVSVCLLTAEAVLLTGHSWCCRQHYSAALAAEGELSSCYPHLPLYWVAKGPYTSCLNRMQRWGKSERSTKPWMNTLNTILKCKVNCKM